MSRPSAVAVLSLVIAIAVAVCAPAASAAPSGGSTDAAGGRADPKRYVDMVFPDTSVTTDVVYAEAPSLVTGSAVPLKLDIVEPAADEQRRRPAIVWVHGGGFRAGTKAMTMPMATDYARRGYVSFSIDYRLDPANRCQDVQDGRVTDPAELEAERARCTAAIMAAQHDAQAAIRWVRAHASTYGVDPSKIAIAGFSAGAVTALHVAYRSDDPGDVGDADGTDSRVQAALSASGCNYEPSTIGSGDAPVFLLHADGDQAVPFACAQDVVARARKAGLVARTMFFSGEATHARALYAKYQARVDAAWTAFLVARLHLA
jgi:predicted esterase